MPVPWAATRARISQVECRGITIQQLRDLRVFLKRLCKVGLLRSTAGQRIEWFNINMYDISDLVVKPAIAHIEQLRGTRERYSWVEFVSSACDQKPQMMFSHSWAGRFRDFMAVVDSMARSRGLNSSAVIWVCTFANSQFGEDFGAGLRDSPFYKAIHLVEETLLVVDRGTSSLQRIWCGLELHLTMQLGKRLQVYTSAGQVGVAVTSGRLVEAVEEWDVTRMEASQDSDRRQILNYLGGGELHENDGLVKDEHSKPVLIDGWKKQLDPATCETLESAPRRSNGLLEFGFEAQLFKEHRCQYQKLSNAVRSNVLAAAMAVTGGSAGRSPCRVDFGGDRGVTLAELRAFAKQVRRWVAAEKSEEDYQRLTVSECKQYIGRAVEHVELSYVEWLGVGPRLPTVIIDEVWSASFADLIETIDWFAEAQQLPESVVLYFTPLCRSMQELNTTIQDWDESIKALLLNCDALLSILPEANEDLIIRANKMQQLQMAFQNDKDVYLGCRDGVVACTSPFVDQCWVFGAFASDIARIILNADWRQIRSKKDSVREKYLRQVGAMRGGIPAFSARLARVVAGPVLRCAARQDTDSSIQEIAALTRRQEFLPNSPVLQGSLGETPTHIAAAYGNLKALALLLAWKADPNAQDHLRETPMHYAALCGRVGAVRMLLSYGAQASNESAFTETPLDVAEQNPAGFLIGANATRKVVALLRAWHEADDSGEDVATEARAAAPEAQPAGRSAGAAPAIDLGHIQL